MLLFNNPTASTTMIALILALIFLCFIISCFLNPIVFLHNRKKTSIAGLLFCIISATDFIICLAWPIAIIYYAVTIDLDKMNCVESESLPRQPQNCYGEATPTNMVIAIFLIILNCSVFMTTGVLAILRSIQIKYPFYAIRKSRALFTLLLLMLAQLVMWSLHSLAFYRERRFHPSFFSVFAVNPYNLDGSEEKVQKISTYISCIPLGLVQILAGFTSAVTAVTLFRERNSGGSSNLTRNRTVGAVKVLLTNFFSQMYGLSAGTPILFLIYQGSNGELVAESAGWIAFFFPVVFPLLSSVWNPIIFVSFTPKSRKVLRSFFAARERNS